MPVAKQHRLNNRASMTMRLKVNCQVAARNITYGRAFLRLEACASYYEASRPEEIKC